MTTRPTVQTDPAKHINAVERLRAIRRNLSAHSEAGAAVGQSASPTFSRPFDDSTMTPTLGLTQFKAIRSVSGGSFSTRAARPSTGGPL